MAGRKNVLPTYQTITAGDMSQATITSKITDITFLDNMALQMDWTGTPVGTFTIYGSLNYAQDLFGNVTNPGNWVPITFSTAPVATGSAGDILINLNQLSFPYLKVIYTKTSGTGVLNAYISGKML
jgi:hypothetical protein